MTALVLMVAGQRFVPSEPSLSQPEQPLVSWPAVSAAFPAKVSEYRLAFHLA